MNQLIKKEKTWITSAHRGFVTEGMVENTLRAYQLAAEKGADMIETDARMTRDGILVVNHDDDVKGFDEQGRPVQYRVADLDYADLQKIRLTRDDRNSDRVPTLSQVLHLAYFTGMNINIDMKDGIKNAADIAKMVVSHGMRGRTVYATNGGGAAAIRVVLAIDPQAKFIDTPEHFTKEELQSIPDYPAKCFAYTADFSDESIARIRDIGCMLATISLNSTNAAAAFRHHPDMAEYPHTSDFSQIDQEILTGFYSSDDK